MTIKAKVFWVPQEGNPPPHLNYQCYYYLRNWLRHIVHATLHDICILNQCEESVEHKYSVIKMTFSTQEEALCPYQRFVVGRMILRTAFGDNNWNIKMRELRTCWRAH